MNSSLKDPLNPSVGPGSINEIRNIAPRHGPRVFISSLFKGRGIVPELGRVTKHKAPSWNNESRRFHEARGDGHNALANVCIYNVCTAECARERIHCSLPDTVPLLPLAQPLFLCNIHTC